MQIKEGLTTHDTARRTRVAGHDPTAIQVLQVLTTDLTNGPARSSVRRITRPPAECQMRRLLILDHNQALMGIVVLGEPAVDATAPRAAGAPIHNHQA